MLHSIRLHRFLTAPAIRILTCGALSLVALCSSGFAAADFTSEWQGVTEKVKKKSTSLKVQFAVSNVGDEKGGSARVGIYLSNNTILDSGDPLLKTVKVKALKPGKTRVIKVKLKGIGLGVLKDVSAAFLFPDRKLPKKRWRELDGNRFFPLAICTRTQFSQIFTPSRSSFFSFDTPHFAIFHI